jgi:hypothetical protein
MMKLKQVLQEYKALVIVGVLAIAGVGFYLATQTDIGLQAGVQSQVEEVAQMNERGATFQEFQDYFRRLSDDKGAVYAFNILREAPMPPGTDLHLLGHTVGDILYKQKGIEGIKDCTDEFRNACSHSVVIGILQDFGEGALPDIADACKEAPGGKGAYTMCFHGLGHGVLAFNGYKLEKAVEMCKKTGTEEYNYREYIECAGGAAMEMMAGVHDRELWAKERPNYVKESDPLFPCSATWMPEEAKSICYIYLTPHLFTAAGANLEWVDPKYYEQSMSFCDALPANAREQRDACYGGFGKEFIVLVKNRDIRDIGSSGPEELTKVHEACALAGNSEGEAACNGHALASLFWGGEANPDASFTFCEIAEGEAQTMCYQQLAGHISFYVTGAKRTQLCNRLPEQYKGQCLATPRP